MRFNLSLCEKEQKFIEKRDRKVFDGLKCLMEKEDECEKEKEAIPSSFESLEKPPQTNSQDSIKSSNETLKSLMMSSLSCDGLSDKTSTEEVSQETNTQKCLPKLALITSGGGFRAMIAYSGAYKV